MTDNKYKLVCFDLDGTIIDETIFIWQTLHDALGTDKKLRQKAMDDYFDGKISYAEWAKHDVKLWLDAGATKEKLMEAIKPLKLMKGAMDTIKNLKSRGYKLAIISGSLDFALSYVMPDYMDYFDYVFINKVEFSSDGSIVKIVPTEFDFEHKASALQKIADKEGFLVSECAFVGDHENDVKIAELAGFSIAFNCKSDMLAQIADVIIKEKDLSKVLDYV